MLTTADYAYRLEANNETQEGAEFVSLNIPTSIFEWE
jgi:hypothetical protein